MKKGDRKKEGCGNNGEHSYILLEKLEARTEFFDSFKSAFQQLTWWNGSMEKKTQKKRKIEPEKEMV